MIGEKHLSHFKEGKVEKWKIQAHFQQESLTLNVHLVAFTWFSEMLSIFSSRWIQKKQPVVFISACKNKGAFWLPFANGSLQWVSWRVFFMHIPSDLLQFSGYWPPRYPKDCFFSCVFAHLHLAYLTERHPSLGQSLEWASNE